MERSAYRTPSRQPGKGFSHARLLGGLLVVALLGCQPAGPTATDQPTGSPQATPTDQPTGSPQPTAAAWPRTLTDDEGTQLRLEGPPQRLISLSPANTEIVFALGAGDRLVGRTDFDDYPPEAAELPAVATYTGVFLERVVELQPDLILAAGNNFTPAGDITRMRELGLDVLVVYAETVEQVLADILLIGRAIGAEGESAAVVSTMESRTAQVQRAVEAIAERPRVFYEIGAEPEIYGPAPDSFIADMVVLAGGEPITTSDPAVFSISVEQLVTLDPEIIILGDAAYGVCPEDVRARPGWSGMAAVRQGAIRPVDDIIVTRPGPRLGEGLAALALAIHPDADIAAPSDARPLCVQGSLGR